MSVRTRQVMIISEYFYCSVSCDESACDFIQRNQKFAIIRELSTLDSIQSDVNNEQVIAFTSTQGNFDDFINDLYECKEQILQALIDEVTIVYEYGSQCNLSFRPDTIWKIGDMGLHLLITCYCTDDTAGD